MINWLQLIGTVVLIYLIWERFRQWKLAGNLPGPPTIPFFGNALMFLRCDVQDFVYKVMQLQKHYSNLCRLWLGHQLIVCVADSKSLEIIFKSNENLNKSVHYEFYNDFLKGVFIAKDEKWRGLRKIVNSVFHTNNVENQLNVFNNCFIVLSEVLEKRCGGETFNIDPYIHRCLLDIVCKIFASSRTDIQLKEGVTYPEDVRLVTQLTNYRFAKIWLHSDFIFNQTAAGRLKKATINKILDFGLDVIKERREILSEIQSSTTEDINSYSKTFLDQMMDYADARNFTDLELSMSISDVLIAGSDTTAGAISYMIMMLAMHEDIQEKVYGEIHDIFGDSSRPVELKDMNRMLLLERVIKEVLRHCCPPHIARRVEKNIKLENTTIPAGSTLYIMLYKLHRDPQYWSHPDSFYPDHFLPENIEKRPKYTFLPFVSGLRACPGQKFSLMMMKVMIATILRKYRITSNVQPSEVNLSLVFMLEISNGYNVQLTER
uniref:Cytochrome P450 CYP439A1v3 n=1 Tax=Laodelphax striatellus TaxID=195883 RepID=K4K2S6_LAOST|nr:cytochrome P450 CYP439A1v3 [Laodelphax striatellus]